MRVHVDRVSDGVLVSRARGHKSVDRERVVTRRVTVRHNKRRKFRKRRGDLGPETGLERDVPVEVESFCTLDR